MAQAKASELKAIINNYDYLLNERHSLTQAGGKKLSFEDVLCWLLSCEKAFDRAAKILDKGVSKRNSRHSEEIRNLFGKLQEAMSQVRLSLPHAEREMLPAAVQGV